MAKTVGTFLAAEARRFAAGAQDADPRAVADVLLGDSTIARLEDGSWGYEFDVQTRWAFYPAGSANMIATYFCARGLGEAGLVCGESAWLDHMRSSAGFVESTLRSDAGWFRYTVDSDVLVHNANLLGAGLVAAAGAEAEDGRMVDRALRAARISIDAQGANGSWPYGARADLAWCDNFHTAYNLDGLLSVWLASADEQVEESLRRGTQYWVSRFFEADGAPRYFDRTAEPFDVHSAGTAIDVASKLAAFGIDTERTARIAAEWTRNHLVAPDGTTYYQWSPRRVDRRHFVRWGDAHVALGFASLGCLDADVPPPLEGSIVAAGRR